MRVEITAHLAAMIDALELFRASYSSSDMWPALTKSLNSGETTMLDVSFEEMKSEISSGR